MRIQRQAPPVRTQVSEVLRQAIRDERFKPGQRLVERELIELTGVSRTSVREALRELAAEGLVRSIANRGMVVADLSIEEARQLYELRSALEALAGSLFVQRASDDQVSQLRHAYELVRLCVEQGASLQEAKDDFYAIMFEGAGNDELRDIVASLHARVRVMRAISLAQPNRPAQTVKEVERIVLAVEARNPEAAAMACSFHVEEAGRVALRAMTERGAAATK